MEERVLIFINIIINSKVQVPMVIVNEMKVRANPKSIIPEKISLLLFYLYQLINIQSFIVNINSTQVQYIRKQQSLRFL
jgi:hypothetical protein